MSRRKKSSTGDRGSSDAYLNNVKDQEKITSKIVRDVSPSSAKPAKCVKIYLFNPKTGEPYLSFHRENGVTLFEI